MVSHPHLKKQTDEARPDKAKEGFWGQQEQGQRSWLTSRQEAQDQGYEAEPGAEVAPHGHGRQERGCSWRQNGLPQPVLCPLGSVSKQKLQTRTRLHSLALPPTTSSLLCKQNAGTCGSPCQPCPHHFPECPSGRAPELPVKEIETAQAPPFADQGLELSPSTTPLCHSSPPQQAQTAHLRGQK